MPKLLKVQEQQQQGSCAAAYKSNQLLTNPDSLCTVCLHTATFIIIVNTSIILVTVHIGPEKSPAFFNQNKFGFYN